MSSSNADQSWRECGHRADYASAAEHERDCPAHGADAWDLLDVALGVALANVEIVDHGPVKPPYGTPERAAYDAQHGGER